MSVASPVIHQRDLTSLLTNHLTDDNGTRIPNPSFTMRKTSPWILLVLVIASVAVSKAVEPDKTWREVEIRHMDVTDAAQALVKERPDLAEALVRIDVRRHMILLDPASPAYEGAVKKLAALDARPKQVTYKMEIAEVTKGRGDTRERVVSRPTITTLEKNPAVFIHHIDGEKSLRISVISKVSPIAATR